MEKFVCNCGREFDKYTSYVSHGRFCKLFEKGKYSNEKRTREEFDTQYLKSGKYVCECGKEFDNYLSLCAHFSHCDLHHEINNLEIKKRSHEINGVMSGWDKFSQYEKEIFTKKSTETLISKIKSGEIIPYWKGKTLPDYMKNKISKGIRKTIKNHPESYCQSNINGRCKKIICGDIVFDSSWEYEVSKILDNENIKWIRPLIGFEYNWNNGIHIYFPDFYLTELDLYIEVKGYERERDREKYKAIQNLIVIGKNLYFKLIKGKVNINDIINQNK